LSQEQVPSLHIQHLPNRLRFTLQQKIASAAQEVIVDRAPVLFYFFKKKT
jgi:hypothetical protein